MKHGPPPFPPPSPPFLDITEAPDPRTPGALPFKKENLRADPRTPGELNNTSSKPGEKVNLVAYANGLTS